jgi:hypothetical protein
MGHEQASTTLGRYTWQSPDRNKRVLDSFAAFSLHPEAEPDSENEDDSDEAEP